MKSDVNSDEDDIYQHSNRKLLSALRARISSNHRSVNSFTNSNEEDDVQVPLSQLIQEKSSSFDSNANRTSAIESMENEDEDSKLHSLLDQFPPTGRDGLLIHSSNCPLFNTVFEFAELEASKSNTSNSSSDHKDATASLDDEDSCSCIICVEPVLSNERGYLPVCNHVFHITCILQWATITNLCPLCKKEFSTVSRMEIKQIQNETYVRILQEVSVPKKEQEIAPLNDEELAEYGFSRQDLEAVCNHCNSGNDENVLLLCDARCGVAAHTYCIGLRSVPRGDWFCDACVALGRRNRSIEDDEEENEDEDVVDISGRDDARRNPRRHVSNRYARPSDRPSTRASARRLQQQVQTRHVLLQEHQRQLLNEHEDEVQQSRIGSFTLSTSNRIPSRTRLQRMLRSEIDVFSAPVVSNPSADQPTMSFSSSSSSSRGARMHQSAQRSLASSAVEDEKLTATSGGNDRHVDDTHAATAASQPKKMRHSLSIPSNSSSILTLLSADPKSRPHAISTPVASSLINVPTSSVQGPSLLATLNSAMKLHGNSRNSPSPTTMSSKSLSASVSPTSPSASSVHSVSPTVSLMPPPPSANAMYTDINAQK
jgi:Ring finger domain/PHD-finger